MYIKYIDIIIRNSDKSKLNIPPVWVLKRKFPL